MLWTNKRIAEIVDRLIAGGQRAFATEALQEMRDEYERTIGTMREDAVRAAVAYEDRIAELEAKGKSYDALMGELYGVGATVGGTIIIGAGRLSLETRKRILRNRSMMP